MKEKLQEKLSAILVILNPIRIYKSIKTALSFKLAVSLETPKHRDLIDINTIDITNLKTEMICDLKIESNELKDIVGDFIFVKKFVKGNCADKYSIDYFKLFTPEDEYGDNEDNQITAICDYLIGLHDKGKYLDSDLEEMYSERVRELYLIRQNDRDIKISKQSLIHSDCLMSIKNPDRRN